jgi:hypothetical protein
MNDRRAFDEHFAARFCDFDQAPGDKQPSDGRRLLMTSTFRPEFERPTQRR